jgi:hypothetical protein
MSTTTTTDLPKQRFSPDMTMGNEAGVIPPIQMAPDAVLASQTGVIIGTDSGRGAPRTPAPPRPEGGRGWGFPNSLGILLLPDLAELPPAQRLVVLMPDHDVSETGLAKYIWTLASPRRLPVLLLGISHDSQEQYRARRRLVTVAAITRDDTVQVEIELAFDQGWKQACRRVWRPGDLIVCHGEQKVAAGLGRRPLAEVLLHSLSTPVYVASGFYPDLSDERVRGVAQLGSLLPPAVILALFFGLQVRLTQATTGSLQTILFVLTVVVEFLLIAAWERLLGYLK